MTLAHRSLSTSRWIPYVALLVVLTSSCKKELDLLPTPSQITVLDAQDDYDAGPERAPATEADTLVPGMTLQPDDDAPTMTIATLTLKPGRVRRSRRLLARITSNKDYAPMGIAKGQNLVWRDTWDSTAVAAAAWHSVLTPTTRPGRPDHVLVRDPRPNRYPPSVVPHQPRLIRLTIRSFAFVLCLDDPMCPTGHCGNF